MDGIYVFLGAGAGIGGIVGLALMAPLIVPRLFTNSSKKFAPEDAARLSATVPVYDRLDTLQQRQLETQVRQFFKHKRFISDGVQIPAILRTGVAGHACMLRLHDQADCYPDIRDVFIGESEQPAPKHRINLSWRAAREALDGGARNAIVRSFSAQLRGAANGAIRNRPATPYPEKWQREFNAAAADINISESQLLRNYGKDAEQDFFLTASEAHFQRGPDLARQHPRIHALLCEFYAVDSSAA